MATALAHSHIEAQRRLRLLAVTSTERLWRSLPGYDREDVSGWLQAILPLVSAAQRQSVALTNAYIARALERQPLGVNTETILAGLRGDTDPATVYERPMIEVWTALGAGRPYEAAVAAGMARATGTVAMDVQMAMRGTAGAIEQADDGVYGYQRVADGDACEFCSAIDGAYVKSADAFPLHNNCGCGLEPLTEPHPRATRLPSGVAVHQHGELGAVLGSSEHSFTSQSDI